MSEFLPLFKKEIDRDREAVYNDITTGFDWGSGEIFEQFDKHWIRFDFEPSSMDIGIIAVDAGRGAIRFRNNTTLFIIRAIAIGSDKRVTPRVFSGTLQSKSSKQLRDFMSTASELCELEAVLSHLKGSDLSKPTFVLIDGSLFTRALSIPMEFRVSRYRDIGLKHIERFYELISIAKREEDLTVIGVSKDSMAHFFYFSLLDELLDIRLKALREKVSREDYQTLRDACFSIEAVPHESMKALRMLRIKYPELSIQDLIKLVDRYRYPYSDVALIKARNPDPGFTAPLEIGSVDPRFRTRWDEIRRDSKSYIERNFQNTIEDKEEDEQSRYIREASKTVSKVLEYPSMVSSHVLLDKNDTSLRLDMFSFDFGVDNKLSDFFVTVFREPSEKFYQALSVLKRGYAGLKMHNLWLYEADRRARLKRGVMRDVYVPYLKKEFKFDLDLYLRRRESYVR
jgi:hypothetical protein